MSEAGETASGRRANKRAAVFRTIGEVAEDLDLPAHVLRFWESKFPQLKPLKRGGGRRYYRPEDIALLSRIRQCLYQEGYTIRGVQKLLSEGMLGASTAEIDAVPNLFPLEPLPERGAGVPAAAPPRRPARPRRAPARAAPDEPVPAASAEPAPDAPVELPPAATVELSPAKSLSAAGKAKLEAAAQDLLSARQLIDALLHRRRKG